MTFHEAHTQAAYPIRFEWGPVGAAACAGPTAVVVDVLSFTTTLSVAVERGVEVYPFGWGDVRATSYAMTRDATLAVGRSASAPGMVTLSPASVRAATDLRRLVLPSPNGSTISVELAATGARVYAACLRNAPAVAGRLGEGPVTVIAAGERWPDGSLRPAVEDLWGAGAVLAALVDRGATGLSPEARVAENAWRAVADRLPDELHACASGRELVASGFPDDVAIAAEVDATDVVPVLDGERFVVA